VNIVAKILYYLPVKNKPMEYSNKLKLSSIVTVIIFLTVLSASTMVNAVDGVNVIYGPEAISTGGAEETPQIALDSNGNAHIVWSSDEGTYLFYKMVGPNGNVLIDETNLNPCANPITYHVRRPSIVIDSNNNVHVVFHGFSLYTQFDVSEYGDRIDLDASEVIYIKINPYLDDMDGSSADFFTITVIPETIISTDDGVKSRAPNIAIDLFDRLHIAWWDGGGGSGGGAGTEIHYLVMDTDGNDLVSETILSTDIYVDVDWGEPEIATDPNGNAHIVYCTDTWDTEREIYYTMVDGDDGSTLIDDTRITSDDGSASVRASLAVDSASMVHVVWHDKRFYDAGTGEHELFYSKLDPSLDDQDGDAADPAVISVISEQLITTNDGYRSYLKNLAVDSLDRVHITWVDMYGFDPEDYDWGKGEIYYQMLDSSGNQIIPETRLTDFPDNYGPACWWYSSGRNPDIAVSKNKVFIVFNVVPDVEEWDSSDIFLIILGPLPVGGEVLPTNTLELIAPYLLTLAVAAGTVGVLFKKRLP